MHEYELLTTEEKSSIVIKNSSSSILSNWISSKKILSHTWFFLPTSFPFILICFAQHFSWIIKGIRRRRSCTLCKQSNFLNLSVFNSESICQQQLMRWNYANVKQTFSSSLPFWEEEEIESVAMKKISQWIHFSCDNCCSIAYKQ